MSFVVSARKYRPTHFDDVVGQEGIADALQRAIDQEKLAQSLLFHGPRGVGKTTSARIVAQKINEKHAPDQKDFSFNVFELDAASNNSVEDIRNLIDQVRFLPQVGKYKVYIIDEVHMLSTAAFNAFLKTLEEPPAHAVFILATTEKQKIPATILSRCQIFDFQRIAVSDMVVQLKKIADLEGVEYEIDALHLIAQKADGAMRDALSNFDKLITFTQGKLLLEAVSKHLNVLDYDQYITLTQHLVEDRLAAALLQLDHIIGKGFGLQLFVAGLGNHFRNLWMARTPETIDLLELTENRKQKYLALAEACDSNFLDQALEICHDLDVNYRNLQNPRLGLELALMKIASIGKTSSEALKKKTTS